MAQKVVLTTDLSPDGFKQLAENIKQIANNLDYFESKLLTLSFRELKSSAKKKVVEQVGQTGYTPTGELANSFQIVRTSKNSGVLLNIHENAAAVEFGTGLMGARSAHPVAAEKGYNYGSKESWVYNDGNEFWKTHGQVGKRFMYDALIEFKEFKLERIAIEAFNETMLRGVKK